MGFSNNNESCKAHANDRFEGQAFLYLPTTPPCETLMQSTSNLVNNNGLNRSKVSKQYFSTLKAISLQQIKTQFNDVNGTKLHLKLHT